MSESITWAARDGSPLPLGATWVPGDQSYNFAIYSKYAEKVTLYLYGPDDFVHPVCTREFELPRHKTGSVWHTRISEGDMAGARYYSYSMDGPSSTDSRYERHAFNPRKVLLDPYATSVFFPPAFDRLAALGELSNVGKAPLGALCGCHPDQEFDWGDDKRPSHDGDLIIYEMHIRQFTMSPSSRLDNDKRGTFSGVVEKIPYLVDLGVTAVELMPVYVFDATEPNFWGYMPLNFFSPHSAYVTKACPGDQRSEFREMVKAFHKANIEVFLDVVYNHTGEGNEHGPTYSMKGIDNSTYYLSSADRNAPYADYTGAGNTLNCANRAVRQLIVDSLSYWVREMHVDGFRFDLASVFLRNTDGSINFNDPPVFDQIADIPNIKPIRFIAEPWEGNAQSPNYQLGTGTVGSQNDSATGAFQRNFPGATWRQWNDKFRTTVRQFVKGDPALVAEVMTRIYGSNDVFPDTAKDAFRPWQSLNYVSSHDGLTLYDLVAYNSADTWNCGEKDGPLEESAAAITLRRQQVKNFCCLLLLSNGTPMFRAGDEFLQSQQGNGNPYDIDSAQTWLDWDQIEANSDIYRFFKKMIVLRKGHPSLGRSVFWRQDIHWFGVGSQPDTSYESHSLAYYLEGQTENDDDLYVMINGYWESLTFEIQSGQPGQWGLLVDTSLASPKDIADPSDAMVLTSLQYVLSARAIAVLVRKKATTAS